MEPFVSVIVPVKEMNDTYLPRCLESLQSSLKAPCEILVMEGGNRAQARNLGLSLAQGQYVAFIDSDCEARSGWPCSLLQHLEKDMSLGGVGGANLSHPSDPILGKILDIVFSTYLGSLRSASFFKSSEKRVAKSIACINSVFRREALIDAGGFDERFELNEDTNLSHRVRAEGYVLLQVPEDVVWHHRRGSVAAFATQMFDYGVGRVRSILTDAAYADWRILAALMTAIVGACSLVFFPTLALVMLISYLCLCGVAALRAAFTCRQPSRSVQVAVLLIVEHASYLAGMIVGFLKGSWSWPKSRSKLGQHLQIGA